MIRFHFIQLLESCSVIASSQLNSPPSKAHFRDNLSLQFPLSCIIEPLIEHGTKLLSDIHLMNYIHIMLMMTDECQHHTQ